jgi:hypothetical protein
MKSERPTDTSVAIEGRRRSRRQAAFAVSPKPALFPAAVFSGRGARAGLPPAVLILVGVRLTANITAGGPQPENVTGTLSMLTGSGMRVKGSMPVIGHDIFDPSEVPASVPPGDFRGIDAGMRKVSGVVRAVPGLNPPTGFDARMQINTFRREAGGMYDGWLKVWMFPYYRDLSSGKIVPSEETALWVLVYVNNPDPLCGHHTYFSDTLRLSGGTGGAELAAGAGGEMPEMEVIRKPAPLFAPYTAGAFLLGQKAYYRSQLLQWSNTLQDDQRKLSRMAPAPSPAAAVIDKNISDLQADLAGRQNDLKTASASDTAMITLIIDNEKKQIAALRQASAASGEQAAASRQFNEALTATYTSAVRTDKEKIAALQQQLSRITARYGALSPMQRNAQAFIMPQQKMPPGTVYADQWDEAFVRLLDPGDRKGVALYTYNPGYFDRSAPAAVQLILLTCGTEGGGPVGRKQWEIIRQADAQRLRALLAGQGGAGSRDKH